MSMGVVVLGEGVEYRVGSYIRCFFLVIVLAVQPHCIWSLSAGQSPAAIEYHQPSDGTDLVYQSYNSFTSKM